MMVIPIDYWPTSTYGPILIDMKGHINLIRYVSQDTCKNNIRGTTGEEG